MVSDPKIVPMLEAHIVRCNIPNFGHTIYRHEPINHAHYIDVLFYIGSNTPLHMNMMICFVYWV